MTSNNLPAVKRYITTHDGTGKAVFSNAIPDEPPFAEIPGAAFGLAYTTTGFPADFNKDQDINAFKPFLETPPGLVLPNGTVLRYVDMSPGNVAPMHRTVSLDYGIVLEGEIELILDSGETRLLKKGDVAVQRATMHSWRNTSSTEWARMIFVMSASNPVEIDGKVLDEDLSAFQQPPESS